MRLLLLCFDNQGVEFWAINTDAQALAAHQALNKVQIGTELTRGLGCGGNPELGRQAALESEEALRRMVQVRWVFLALCTIHPSKCSHF